jgi:hypothetical protein
MAETGRLLSKILLGLAVFDAGFYVGVGRFDEFGESCGVGGGSGFQFYVAHESAGALQESSRVGQRCALEETDICVRREYVDVAEGNVSQAGDGAAVVQEFADFVAAVSHHFEPLVGDDAEFAGVAFHPGVDGGRALDGAVESQDLCFHRLHVAERLQHRSH